jgi:hypothetical protein
VCRGAAAERVSARASAHRRSHLRAAACVHAAVPSPPQLLHARMCVAARALCACGERRARARRVKQQMI